MANATTRGGSHKEDKDVVAITEAVVGISEGNYVTVDDIGVDLLEKYPEKEVGLVFPILSRNRFSMILKAVARAMNKITILLSFPADEVGNGIVPVEKIERRYRDLCGRLLVEIASRSKEVYRVICGIGQKIK